MIDYDKLKIAHELALNLDNILIKTTFYNSITKGMTYFLEIKINGYYQGFEYICIDDLIEKLTELTNLGK